MQSRRFSTLSGSFLLAALTFAASVSPAKTILVRPDGTGPVPNILAGIDLASPGDTVLLADGVFLGTGNRDLTFFGKAITLRSKSGDPEACIIDCQGSGLNPHRGIFLYSGEGPETLIEGITIRGGYLWEISYPNGHGSAICCRNAHATVRRCILTGNTSRHSGGAIFSAEAELRFEDCRVIGNYTPGAGGGACLESSVGEFVRCEFSGNEAVGGGGIAPGSHSVVTLTSCTIAGNEAINWGGGIWGGPCQIFAQQTVIWGNCAAEGAQIYISYSLDTSMTLACCCLPTTGIYGHAYMHFHGDQVRSDPLFCGALPCTQSPTPLGEYTLNTASPCLPEGTPCGELIGAYGIGCGPSVAEDLPGWRQIDPEPGPIALRLLGPNPTDSRVACAATLASAGPATVSLFDPAGRQVARLLQTDLPPGETRLDLPLGDRLQSGMYLLVLETPAGRASASIIRVR